HQKRYLERLLTQTYDFNNLTHAFSKFFRERQNSLEFEDPEMNQAVKHIWDAFMAENSNTQKFQRQLLQLLASGEDNKLLERLEKGSDYYYTFLKDSLKKL